MSANAIAVSNRLLYAVILLEKKIRLFLVDVIEPNKSQKPKPPTAKDIVCIQVQHISHGAPWSKDVLIPIIKITKEDGAELELKYVNAG